MAFLKKTKDANVSKNVNPCTPLVGMEIGKATMENSMESPRKIKNRDTIQFNNCIQIFDLNIHYWIFLQRKQRD